MIRVTEKMKEIEEKIFEAQNIEEALPAIRKELRAELLDQALMGNGHSTVSDAFVVNDENVELTGTTPCHVIHLFFQVALEEWTEELTQMCDGGRVTWYLPKDEIKITTFQYAYKQIDTGEVLIR